ncbi:MAG: glycosyltransferase family protein [Rhodospirillaceae bacterium]|nr:glycosyltransferase family protein [Rhodospirillaceae bacterium]
MILAVLQARVSSSRFPGKVLAPLLGQPMLFRQIERVRRCREIQDLVVATSTDPSDDALAEACGSHGVKVARGNLNDVLDRFITAATPFNPAAVVRLTGDCPLADPETIDAVVAHYRSGAFDYVSNVEPATYPDGLDTEIIRMEALTRAHRDARLQSEREHVTLFIRNHPEIFRRGNIALPENLSHMRWTVDEPADLVFVEAVYRELYPSNPAFSLADILDLLRRKPQLADINAGFERNAGLAKSLAEDKEVPR